MARVGADYIARAARQRGLDPNAVGAVGGQEGYGGGIGDGGTSFGPFQLHKGGALPSNIPLNRANDWAWSVPGVNYALDAMVRAGAKGLTGAPAVNTIVRKFERPADPDSEVSRALAHYSHNVFNPAQGAGIADANPNRKALVDWALSSSKAFLNDTEQPNLISLMKTFADNSRAALPSTQKTPDVPLSNGFGGLVTPIHGKIIGTPYQGTHGKEFNNSAGSGNWESENAIDIAAPVGTPIRAVTSGTIGNQFGSLGEGGRFAGLRLHLNGGGNEYYYAHLSRYADGIKPGAVVKAGQIIGYSGEANGVGHLHLASAKGNPLSIYGGG